MDVEGSNPSTGSVGTCLPAGREQRFRKAKVLGSNPTSQAPAKSINKIETFNTFPPPQSPSKSDMSNAYENDYKEIVPIQTASVPIGNYLATVAAVAAAIVLRFFLIRKIGLKRKRR